MTDAVEVEHDRLREWDAAFVLGALAEPERARYAAHVAECARCAASVEALAAVPDALALTLVASAQESQPAAAPHVAAPHAVAARPRRLRRTGRRGEPRRRIRRRLRLLAGAALVVAVVVAIPIAIATIARPAEVSVALERVSDARLHADVTLRGEASGTAITVVCGYDVPPAAGVLRTYDLVVVADGEASTVASWEATAQGDVVESTRTDAAVADIEAVRIVEQSSGTIVLEHRFD